jgi:hypothetical protein
MELHVDLTKLLVIEEKKELGDKKSTKPLTPRSITVLER